MPVVSSAASAKHILVIEDDAAIRETLAEILEFEGYRVTVAANGREGLQRSREARPAVILLDLMMPVMNGYEFRAEQKASADLASIPIIMISADGNLTQKAAAIDTPHFLKKPIELDVLLETIKKFV